jgi:hypothetical protein
MVEVIASLYLHMTSQQRESFCRALPRALLAFAEQDYGAWRSILRRCHVPLADQIVSDAESAGFNLLVRDFSGVRRVVRTLGIEDRIDFDFAAG